MVSDSVKRSFVHISMVFSKGMLGTTNVKGTTNKEIKLFIKDFFIKWNESFIANSLIVKVFKIGTKNFESLYVGVFKADRLVEIAGNSPHLLYVPCMNRT